MICVVEDSITANLCLGFPFLVVKMGLSLIRVWHLPFLPIATILPQPLIPTLGSAEREWLNRWACELIGGMSQCPKCQRANDRIVLGKLLPEVNAIGVCDVTVNTRRGSTPANRAPASRRGLAAKRSTAGFPLGHGLCLIVTLRPRCDPPGSANRCSREHCSVMFHKGERSCRCRAAPRSALVQPGPLNRCQSR